MSGQRSRAWAPVALAALIVLAGCPVGSESAPGTPGGAPADSTPGGPGSVAGPATTGGPPNAKTGDPAGSTARAPCETEAATADSSPDPTPTASSATPFPPSEVNASDYAIPVRGNGSFPFDVNRTYARTLAFLDIEAEPPAQIYRRQTAEPWRPTIPGPFARTLVDGRETTNFSTETRTGITLSNPGDMPTLDLRYTLVHEYVHSLQFQRADDSTAFRAMGSGREGVHGDAAFAIVEGSASYVAFEYARTYTNHSTATILNATDEYRDAGPAGKFVWGPYHFGRRYAAARVDSPADHWRLYENPPRTTEELIHAREPGSEPVRPLSVSVAADEWSVADRDSRGELFVRTVLTAELPESRAARGAAGWGNDRVVRVEADDEVGYAWALRWDDAANATEFLGAFCAAMGERGERTDGRWSVDEGAVDVVRVAPETAVVFSGSAGFVANATARGGNANVTVVGN
ncbi:hypothetical protein [Halosimplex amylolyticum]|uniref:hypothetical protein n=1 Tax=Halosimplex amylolyticum TaxID=3396616 RepID=UPI003F56D559